MNSYTGDFHPDDGPSVDDLANQIEQEAAQEQEKLAAPGPRQGNLPTPNPSTISITEKKPLRRAVKKSSRYPVEALGEFPASVARALANITKSPIEACGSVVLSGMNKVAQAHRDLVLPHGRKALSLYFMVLMPSGERKSSLFAHAFRSIREFEKQLRIAFAQSKKSGDELPPPVLIISEGTIDGIIKFAEVCHGSFLYATDEAAIFTNGHSMGNKDLMRSCALFSLLWDGATIYMARAATDNRCIAGKRMSACFLAQHDAVAVFIANGQIQAQGLLGRFLIVMPTSLIGSRMYEAPCPEDLAILDAYHARMLQLLSMPMPLVEGTTNELAPRDLRLSEAALARFAAFHDEVEAQCAEGGKYQPVRENAAKAAEQALRIGGTLAFFDEPEAEELHEKYVERGVTFAHHYLDEALRIASNEADPDLVLAEKTLKWIEKLVARDGTKILTLTNIYRNGPTQIRQVDVARKIAGILTDHGYLAVIEGGAVIDGKVCEAFRIL